MLQTFTCCTFPQAKERIREVRSLTLFSRLEILTSFTRLFAKSPRVPNYFELTAIFEINWRVAFGCLIYQCPSICRINDTTIIRHQFFIEILNVGSKCIKPDLSSKFTLLSMFMHNG